jgi:DNA-binding MarR family transcriptional regulator
MEEARRLLDLLRIHGLLNGVKLGILLALYHIDGYVTFTDLQRALDLPKSSLHEFLDDMSRVGLVEYRRAITDLGVRAVVKITDKGREVVKQYVELVKGAAL